LRERPDDIPVLVRYFAHDREAYAPRDHVHSIRDDGCARAIFWPGNIRELQNSSNVR
jgi:transcriptional regulator with PAS, ATPase and Fis domain